MKRVREFDDIRGLAALSVMVFHLADRGSYALTDNSLPFPCTFPLGGYGVETFFMLSGFVIFLSLEKQTSIISFYKSRFISTFLTFKVDIPLRKYLQQSFL